MLKLLPNDARLQVWCFMNTGRHIMSVIPIENGNFDTLDLGRGPRILKTIIVFIFYFLKENCCERVIAHDVMKCHAPKT